MHIKNIILNL